MKLYIVVPLALLGCLVFADAIYLAMYCHVSYLTLLCINPALFSIYLVTHRRKEAE